MCKYLCIFPFLLGNTQVLLPIISRLGIVESFGISQSRECVLVSLCGLNLHFPND
jgi:hypothetical protein